MNENCRKSCKKCEKTRVEKCSPPEKPGILNFWRSFHCLDILGIQPAPSPLLEIRNFFDCYNEDGEKQFLKRFAILTSKFYFEHLKKLNFQCVAKNMHSIERVHCQQNGKKKHEKFKKKSGLGCQNIVPSPADIAYQKHIAMEVKNLR